MRRPLNTALHTLTAFLFLSAAMGATVRAQVWSEAGDAGDLPASAQTTVGEGALTTLIGSLASDVDVDMYCIQIVDEASFLARLQCAVMLGPSPYLFDSSGVGVATNETCSGGDKLISSAFVTTGGLYYLAVAFGGRAALAGADDIWLPAITTERAPDGPGAANPVDGWGGVPVVQPQNPYTVFLAGVEFCDSPVPVDESTWGLVKTLYR